MGAAAMPVPSTRTPAFGTHLLSLDASAALSAEEGDTEQMLRALEHSLDAIEGGRGAEDATEPFRPLVALRRHNTPRFAVPPVRFPPTAAFLEPEPEAVAVRGGPAEDHARPGPVGPGPSGQRALQDLDPQATSSSTDSAQASRRLVRSPAWSGVYVAGVIAAALVVCWMVIAFSPANPADRSASRTATPGDLSLSGASASLPSPPSVGSPTDPRPPPEAAEVPTGALAPLAQGAESTPPIPPSLLERTLRTGHESLPTPSPAAVLAARVGEAERLYKTGQAQGARRLVQRVLAEDPNQPRALLLHSNLLIEAREYEQALVTAEAALAADPLLAHAYLAVGFIHQERGALALAVPAYRRYLELVPDDVYAPSIRRQLRRIERALQRTAPHHP
jgi:hypothetical protein